MKARRQPIPKTPPDLRRTSKFAMAVVDSWTPLTTALVIHRKKGIVVFAAELEPRVAVALHRQLAEFQRSGCWVETRRLL